MGSVGIGSFLSNSNLFFNEYLSVKRLFNMREDGRDALINFANIYENMIVSAYGDTKILKVFGSGFQGTPSEGMRSVDDWGLIIDEGARNALDNKYKISEFIDTNKQLQIKNNVTLYRGIAVNQNTYDSIISNLNKSTSIDMQGISSWSTQENVAHMYATDEYSKMIGDKTRSIIFINEGRHKNAIVYPWTEVNEVIQSKNVKYHITKIKEYEYNERDYYNAPATYVYLQEI